MKLSLTPTSLEFPGTGTEAMVYGKRLIPDRKSLVLKFQEFCEPIIKHNHY